MAGHRDCDRFIAAELRAAGIATVPRDRSDGEVPATIAGKLGPFVFERAWYYWVVDGLVPLDVARTLYDHPDGRRDVRVAGHCACPPPEDWAHYFDADGVQLYSDPDGSEARKWAAIVARFPHFEDGRVRYVPDAAAVAARAGVDTYHIDTQAGLCLFADTIRARGLHEAGR